MQDTALSQAPTTETPSSVNVPHVSVLAVSALESVLLTTDGELQTYSTLETYKKITDTPLLLCYAPNIEARIKAESPLRAFDVCELFAFVHPTKFCVPTILGLAKALDITAPKRLEDHPETLLDITKALLQDLRNDPWAERAPPLDIAAYMSSSKSGFSWPWTSFVFDALGQPYNPNEPKDTTRSMHVWKKLPEWAEESTLPSSNTESISKEETRDHLKKVLGFTSENRPQQSEYAQNLSAAFDAKEESVPPHVILAEAGTGVGKTLGYLTPAHVWSHKNGQPVWISTYTKNLQRQIDQELSKIYPDPETKDALVSVRKGRENYLCLLNFEDMATHSFLSHHPKQAIASGILARWVAATKDGDINGGDFPGWLVSLLGFRHTSALADRRGECIYAACEHYNRCFVEKSIRKSKHAHIVVANHALVMIHTALRTAITDPDDPAPKRFIFDEGHHVFDAADSAFSAHLTAKETSDLRRWIKGAEEGRKTRARGLKRRMEDLISALPECEKDVEDIIRNASILTAYGWVKRLTEGMPKGPCEAFIYSIYNHVFSSSEQKHSLYSLEVDTQTPPQDLTDKAKDLRRALLKLQKPMQDLATKIRKKLTASDETIEKDTRKRLESVMQSLERRAQQSLSAWIAMLDDLISPEKQEIAKERFVDWMAIERIDGKTVDIGLYRHWANPMIPFADSMKDSADGIVFTSATLRDGTLDDEENWRVARERTGTSLITKDPMQSVHSSPFLYATQTRIFVINDVPKENIDAVAQAYQDLFAAAKGGALGLFTAIQRLRLVHDKICTPLEKKGLHLYGQHIDALDNGTLVDIFREDTHACLLGTDAIRDGVDVPGESLRLIVFDRVPWPRPDLLHKARREVFGKKRYDDMITCLKLKQAYGRLIRRSSDKGVFVILDSRLPSRMEGAFPETTLVQRIGLQDALKQIQDFL